MSNGHCVEAGACQHGDVLVRDSKDPGGPVLTFSEDAWARFVSDIKRFAWYAGL